MSGCGADKHLVSTDCLRQGISKSMTKVGWFRDGPIPLRFQGGVARSAGVVRKRSRSLLICPRSDPYFLSEITNHPDCAAKERGLFIRGAATPLKGGEWIRLATNHSPSAPDPNLWDSSERRALLIFGETIQDT